jgi:hypothetical protein
MIKIHHLILTLFTSAPLLACSQPSAPPAPPSAPPSPTVDNNAPSTLIGRKVGQAISEARAELRTKNITISDGFDLNVNGHHMHRDTGLPKAEISPQGDLLIEGKSVAINASQRTQLINYRGHIVAIADAGMQIGAKGADIAGVALNGVVGAIFGGKQGEANFKQRMDAQGKKIEVEAMKLCMQLPPMLASQQALAASLPAFKPYATMTQGDIDDCSKHDKPNVAVTSG